MPIDFNNDRVIIHCDGSGDLFGRVCNYSDEQERGNILKLVQTKSGKIGRKNDTKKQINNKEILLVFDNYESVECMIKQLNLIKDNLFNEEFGISLNKKEFKYNKIERKLENNNLEQIDNIKKRKIVQLKELEK